MKGNYMKGNSKKINGSLCKWTVMLLILGLCACVSGCAGTKQQDEEVQTEEIVTYDDIAGAYRAEIFMTEEQSVLLYLQITEDGGFVFARDDQFNSTEKGAGYLGRTEDGEDAFFYEIVNGSEVESGEYIATYLVDDDGNIQFTSPMWFGSTSPKMTNEDESVTYPCFVNLESIPEEEGQTEEIEEEEPEASKEEEPEEPEEEPEAAADIDTKTSDSETADTKNSAEPENTEPAAAEAAAPEPEAAEPAAPQSALIEGTYCGSLEKYVDAMDSTIRYDVTVTFQNGSYSYTVNITLSGSMEYSGQESYSGSYSVNGDSMSMTGSLSGGTVYGSSVTISGLLSSFAGQQESITVFQ